ncbi:hypothetical protein [Pseudolactococcus carnosus]|uniref:hypothetical protein n=1 Tax=Pseudolactococcus carnosus TaxID=2749961 RepID=UPI001FBBC723|nr:hypothetical protein [Lactococcus carnosus]MCJ1972061.1 hypothetical protein [Lactococcus carnosus]MCJ2002273.1 hypothetical protein [Lactococcus carnosus]
MTKQEKELLEEEFMKTLKMGLQLTSIQADMLENDMNELDKKMTELDDDLDEANK